MGIEHTEYEARQAAARRLAQERGFSALVAWSRGGSTQDHYADVYYLTGFYTHQPFIPDEPGRWRAHGHTALVLPVDGPPTLLVDMTEVQDPKPVADRVRVTEDLVESLATTVTDTVPPGTDVALLGGEALVWRWGRELNTRLPGHRFFEADDLAAEMRLIKSGAEFDLLRAAGEIGTSAVDAAMEAAVPGVTEAEVAAEAIAEIVRAGGALYGLGLSSGPWAHTFSPSTPASYSRRGLEAGDMIRLDLYGSFEATSSTSVAHGSSGERPSKSSSRSSTPSETACAPAPSCCDPARRSAPSPGAARRCSTPPRMPAVVAHCGR
jgi:Xaa-Pro dipeptidase